MKCFLVCQIVLLGFAATPGFADPTPEATGTPPLRLAEILRADPKAEEAWPVGAEESAQYDATRFVSGATRYYKATVTTSSREYTRESYTRAAWPHGDKPVVTVLERIERQRVDENGAEVMTTAVADRDEPQRALKLVVSVHDDEGVTSKQFDFWRPKPWETYISARDGEGVGSRVIDGGADALFEEQLPLVLRALDFKDGARAYFPLYEGQCGAGAAKPRTALAMLNVSRPGGDLILPAGTWKRDDAWQVAIETQDGRVLKFAFAAAAPHEMLSSDCNDGRSLRLVSSRVTTMK